jgi:hydrogenase small subunit
MESIAATAQRHGIDRRTLLRWSAGIAGVLALPAIPFAARIANALETAPRLPVLWLNGQDCMGDSESLLRSSAPTPSQLILDQLSLDYAELLMAPSGSAAEDRLRATIDKYAGKYVLVVEGAIPTASNGIFCCVGGRSFVDLVKEVAAQALAVVAVGSCAADGGLPRAAGGVTGAASVSTVLANTGKKIIRFPGCPMNIENLTATLTQYITLGTWPETDSTGLPLFAYGARIHRSCERLPFFRAGQFVETWGDEGHQKGWCLRQVGCQGPQTSANCPTKKFNSATSWPVSSGAPCLGCTKATFWADLPNAFSWTPPATTITTATAAAVVGAGQR